MSMFGIVFAAVTRCWAAYAPADGSVAPLSGAGWTVDGSAVVVPHVFDGETAANPAAPCPRRTGTYARKLPAVDLSKRWFVRFEGVSIKAVVSVNGREVGRHAGAFTPFTFEITPALKPDGNVLEVFVDNRFDYAVVPIAGDFTMSGGIYRDVWLLSAPKDVVFKDGFFAEEIARRVKPRAEFRPDGFYVDGKRTFMKGVNYHQDGPNGWLLAPDQEERDLRMIQAMGANAIRTAHYPRSEKFYDLCDKLGLFVWTETPLVNCLSNDAPTRANLMNMTREMVLAHKHHPCIIGWGLFNELYETPMPAGTAEPVVKDLNAFVHGLDPDRPTLAATDKADKKELNAIPDVLGINIYPGWYWGWAKHLGYHWEVQVANNNRKTCAVSEFGAGASVEQHRNPAGERPAWNGRFHPEEYQTKFHHDAWASLQGKPQLWGVFVWQMFDTRSAERKEGDRDGVNDKGLVTRDRLTKKDAYFFYKANWNPEPMLHLAGARMTETTNAVHEVVGFCNLPGKVTLRVNGQVVGEQAPDAVRQVLWSGVPLAPGKNILELSAGALKASATLYRHADDRKTIEPLPGERWWGGATIFGRDQPYGMFGEHDQNRDNYCNQISPFFVSSAGRYAWSEKPVAWSASNGVLTVSGSSPIVVEKVGATLKEAFLAAAKRHFPSTGKIPPEIFFTRPQYNHAIESHVAGRNQASVEAYAKALVAHGFPMGVVIVDDYWMRDFGTWRFDKEAFPDPKGMVERLHALGAKVMLWVVPYISADSLEGLDLYNNRWIAETPTPSVYGRAAIVRWWSGYSYAYDFTVREARDHFTATLRGLQRDYGVDGFKFDGADLNHYTFTSPTGARFRRPLHTPADNCRDFSLIAEEFPYNELRASYNTAGRALVQRLQDKAHGWNDLQELIPDMLAAGLLGYAYTCADMIGGGLAGDFFEKGFAIDHKLFVRSCQVHALMPMMQFSLAPWRVLTPEETAICKAAADLHVATAPRILELARQASQTGEPIVRHMEWEFPNQGFAECRDQFMLGDDLLVAPVLSADDARTVCLPKGAWTDDLGARHVGPKELKLQGVPLARLPRYRLERK